MEVSQAWATDGFPGSCAVPGDGVPYAERLSGLPDSLEIIKWISKEFTLPKGLPRLVTLLGIWFRRKMVILFPNNKRVLCITVVNGEVTVKIYQFVANWRVRSYLILIIFCCAQFWLINIICFVSPDLPFWRPVPSLGEVGPPKRNWPPIIFPRPRHAPPLGPRISLYLRHRVSWAPFTFAQSEHAMLTPSRLAHGPNKPMAGTNVPGGVQQFVRWPFVRNDLRGLQVELYSVWFDQWPWK